MKQRCAVAGRPGGGLALTGVAARPARSGDTARSAGKLVVWDWKSSDKTAAKLRGEGEGRLRQDTPGRQGRVRGPAVRSVLHPAGRRDPVRQGPRRHPLQRRRPDPRPGGLAPAPGPVRRHGQERLAGWDAFKKDGKTYAAPVTLQGHPIYYNKTLYTKAGLDPAKPPATWDAMISACAAIKKAAGVPCFAQGNKEGYGIQFWMSGLGSGILTPTSTTSGSPASGTGTART